MSPLKSSDTLFISHISSYSWSPVLSSRLKLAEERPGFICSCGANQFWRYDPHKHQEYKLTEALAEHGTFKDGAFPPFLMQPQTAFKYAKWPSWNPPISKPGSRLTTWNAPDLFLRMQEQVVTSRTASVISKVKTCLGKRKITLARDELLCLSVFRFCWSESAVDYIQKFIQTCFSRPCSQSSSYGQKCSSTKKSCFRKHRSCWLSNVPRPPYCPCTRSVMRNRSHMAKHISACDFTFHHQTSLAFRTESSCWTEVVWESVSWNSCVLFTSSAPRTAASFCSLLPPSQSN